MCDYSLKHMSSRPAKVGDKLVTTKFSNSITRGFSAPGESNVAVCVLPGTELSFAEEVRASAANPVEAIVSGIKEMIGVPPKAGHRTATFVQVNKHNACLHHDALRFPDGSIVLLTNLDPGQGATVLTLPADPATLQDKAREKAEEEQRQADYV
jgi:hypothetical protein